MLICKEYLRDLEEWSPRRFSDWLLFNLRGDVLQISWRSRWEPLHDLIIPTRPLLEQLGEIYELLEEGKPRFVLGLGGAIRSCVYYADGHEVFRTLADLIGYANIAEGAPYLVEYARDVCWIPLLERKQREELFALAFNIIAGMVPARCTKRLVRELAQSPLYCKKYDAMLSDAINRE